VACTGVKGYTNRALMGKPERNRPLVRPGYIYIYIKSDGGVWIRFTWLRIETSVRLM
jgi:hypothetical protein